MHKWRVYSVLLLIGLLTLSGCGSKAMPQIAGIEKPQINNLKDKVIGNVLALKFVLSGNIKGVGFQIDRSQIDPYCQCPGFWRRFYDRQPMASQVGAKLKKLIDLKTDKIEYLFRIRAYDADGNLGPWSHAIHARGVDLSR